MRQSHEIVDIDVIESAMLIHECVQRLLPDVVIADSESPTRDTLENLATLSAPNLQRDLQTASAHAAIGAGGDAPPAVAAATTTAAASRPRFCTACGTPAAIGARFCSNCSNCAAALSA